MPVLQDLGEDERELVAKRLGDAAGAADQDAALGLGHQRRRGQSAADGILGARRRSQHNGSEQERHNETFHGTARGENLPRHCAAILLNNSFPDPPKERPMTPRQAIAAADRRSAVTRWCRAPMTRLTARLVEAAGFAAVYLTGGGYSRASGYPDLGPVEPDRERRCSSAAPSRRSGSRSSPMPIPATATPST